MKLVPIIGDFNFHLSEALFYLCWKPAGKTDQFFVFLSFFLFFLWCFYELNTDPFKMMKFQLQSLNISTNLMVIAPIKISQLGII